MPVSYRFHNFARELISCDDLAGTIPLALERYQRLMEYPATTPQHSKMRNNWAIEGAAGACESKGSVSGAAAWRSKLDAAKAEQGKADARP